MEKTMKRVFKAADELDTIHNHLNNVTSTLAVIYQTIVNSKNAGDYFTITTDQVRAVDNTLDQLLSIVPEMSGHIQSIQGICREEPADA